MINMVFLKIYVSNNFVLYFEFLKFEFEFECEFENKKLFSVNTVGVEPMESNLSVVFY